MTITEVAIKSTPPAVLTAWSAWGFTLTEWGAILGILYSCLMIFFLLKDRWTNYQKELDECKK